MSPKRPKICRTGANYSLEFLHVEVDQETLRRLGWKRVEARRTANKQQIAEFFAELYITNSQAVLSENSRNLSSADYPVDFAESSARIGDLFYYFGINEINGAETLFSIASVDAKIDKAFSYEGLPTLPQSFIRRGFHQFRLYAPVVLHRFKYCSEKWRDRLQGVHMGSENPAVLRAVRSGIFVVPFVYVGEKSQSKSSQENSKSHFLWLRDSFKSDLLRPPSPRSTGEHPAWLAFQTQVERLLKNEFRSGDYQLMKLAAESQFVRGALANEGSLARIKLLSLLAAIPIKETAEVLHATLESEFPLKDRRRAA